MTKDHNNNRINFSIDSLDEMLKAKLKTQRVIKSCKTNDQLNSAKRLCSHYFERTEDMVGTSELELEILSKRKEVGEGKFTKRDWNKFIKQMEKND